MKARNKTLLHYDAILFDVDGTLIDSAPGIIHTLQEVFCTMGVDVSGINLRRYLGPPLRKSFGEHFTDPALIEKATDLYRTSYAVKGSHECAVFPGVPQMLQTLKQAGFILCTATSKPTKVVTPILEEQGLAQYFDYLGGASMDESRDTKTEVVRYVLSQPALQGKRVLIVDDVISTGESLTALETLVREVGGTVAGRMAVLAEGDAIGRKDIRYLAPLPLFHPDGTPKG